MILFIDATIRDDSRTLELSKYYLNQCHNEIMTLKLIDEDLRPLNEESLKLRDQLIEVHDFSHPMFKYARLFKEADAIVIGAPYYDLSFPASLKLFIENITVNDLTFGHDASGNRLGLCKADKLVYITTSGGPIIQDYGYSYIKDLCEYMYGIHHTECITCEGLDMITNNPSKLLEETKKEIDQYFRKQKGGN